MAKSYFEGSGVVSASEQARAAYKQMRRSLIKYAEVEAKFGDIESMTSIQEEILVAERKRWRDRVLVFAAVYHVEVSVARGDAEI